MSTTSSLPQIAKAVRTRKTHDLSYITISMIISGGILWTVYGVFLHDLPLIIWDVIPACLYTSLLIIKYLCDNNYLPPKSNNELESIKIIKTSKLSTHKKYVHVHHPIHIHRHSYSPKILHTKSVISV